MKRLFGTTNQSAATDIALLLMRIVCGYALIRYGWLKMHDPFHWMGRDSTTPHVFQFLAAISEFGGGIAFVLGFLTRLGALGIACTMIVAVAMQRFEYGVPFIDLNGGSSYVLAATFLAIALLLLSNGSGRYSVDRAIFGVQSDLNAGLN